MTSAIDGHRTLDDLSTLVLAQHAGSNLSTGSPGSGTAMFVLLPRAADPLITMRVALLSACRRLFHRARRCVLRSWQRFQPPRPPSRSDVTNRRTCPVDEGPKRACGSSPKRPILTRFVRIVVTDEQGRYVLPDLPPATYDIFFRGYGLSTRPGRADLASDRPATWWPPSEREAAAVYPARTV